MSSLDAINEGRNRTGETSYPALAEGIVTVDDWLAVLTESGAAKYQSGGLDLLDAIISFFAGIAMSHDPLAGNRHAYLRRWRAVERPGWVHYE